MSYLQALENSQKAKVKVANTQEIIDTLWQNKKAQLINGYGEKYEAAFSRIEDYLDIILCKESETVGFISLKIGEAGKYSIVNNAKLNRHPDISLTPGHGLAVKEKFRKRGLGAALLSLGIGIAQKDFKEKNSSGTFKVLATDITDSGFGCYKNFGFRILDGMTVSEGYYSDSDRVPEINFLRHTPSFWARLKKRL
jgi:ribosomal protein S18 acetylase RimI-like enzyme